MSDFMDKFIRFGNSTDEKIIGDSPRNPNEIFNAEDGVITPKIGPSKKEGKPIVVVIDDDYPTLDILKVYLQRDYECVTFSDPKKAVFYLNDTVPALILLDRHMSLIDTHQIVDIVRTYNEMKKIPIFYLVDSDELVPHTPDKSISGYLTRPVKRGDLAKIIEWVFKENHDNVDVMNEHFGIDSGDDTVPSAKVAARTFSDDEDDEPIDNGNSAVVPAAPVVVKKDNVVSFDDDDDDDKPTKSMDLEKSSAGMSFDDDDDDGGFGVFD